MPYLAEILIGAAILLGGLILGAWGSVVLISLGCLLVAFIILYVYLAADLANILLLAISVAAYNAGIGLGLLFSRPLKDFCLSVRQIAAKRLPTTKSIDPR